MQNKNIILNESTILGTREPNFVDFLFIMKKLISMTDFVLQDWSKYEGYDSLDYRVFAYNKAVILESYANFLKQPLTLGMFVPTDENGNLIEFGKYSFPTDEEMKHFQQAKENVLFKGDFKVTEYKKWNLIEGEKHTFSFHPFESDCLKVENLIDRGFELTESAIKKYFSTFALQ